MIITSLSKHACNCKYLSSPSYDLSLFLNYIVQDNDEKSDIGLSVQIPKRKEEGFEKKIEEHQATQSGNTLTWSCHKFHFDQVI